MVQINITLILLGISLAFLGVVAYLYYIERDIKRRIIRHESSEKYKTKISYLKRSKKKTESAIKEIDDLAKEFIKDAFKVGPDKDYAQLQKEFLKKGNKDLADFCEKMTEIYYVKDGVKREDLKELIDKLETIVHNHRIKPLQEQNTFDKVNKFLRESFVSSVK